MKNLATCSPLEFLKQTNLIRRSAEKWMKHTDILNIRKRMPQLEVVPFDATQEQREQIAKANREKAREQVLDNLNEILTNIMEKYPEETVELLALACFVEPSAANKYPMTYYMKHLNDLINDEVVISFFTSLVRLGQTSGSESAEA